MATNKLERQMNLVICLLSTKQFLSAEKIRELVAGYEPNASEDAFARMFERDKQDLRTLGIPIETGPAPGEVTADAYRISRSHYELPAISMTPEESAAVAIAAHSFGGKEINRDMQSAFLKLTASGIDIDSDAAESVSQFSLTPATGSHPDIPVILQAISEKRAITFDHAHSPAAEPLTRVIEPWGVRTRYGRWYVIGYDRDRQAPRVFRLSRIRSAISPVKGKSGVVPFHDLEDRTVDELVDAALARSTEQVDAEVWVAEGKAVELRRQASSSQPELLRGRVGDRVRFTQIERHHLLSLLVGYGANAYLHSPAELREDVIALWQSFSSASASSSGENQPVQSGDQR